jgi:DinB superfamily
MDPKEYIAALEENAPVIAALARAMPSEAVAWRPTPDDWSVLEVVNHLADEEREDFRARLDFSLRQPGGDPPQHDPASWPTARAYNSRDLEESLGRFLAAREESLAWLHGLGSPDWSRAWTHSSGFHRSAGDFLVSWAAHDLLHLRQLVEIQFAYRAMQAVPYSVAYAGPWEERESVAE